MTLTTDRTHPDLNVPEGPGRQNKVYLVLSDEDIAKGYVKPYRDAYIHDSIDAPKGPLRELTAEERAQYDQFGYTHYEEGDQRFWTKDRLERSKRRCGVVTTMGFKLSATYARDPRFYGATYCCGCGMHYPLNEFHWTADGEPMDPNLQEAWAEEQKTKRDMQRARDAEWNGDRLKPEEVTRISKVFEVAKQQEREAAKKEGGLKPPHISLPDILARLEKAELEIIDLKAKRDER